MTYWLAFKVLIVDMVVGFRNFIFVSHFILIETRGCKAKHPFYSISVQNFGITFFSSMKRFSFECRKVVGFGSTMFHDWLKKFAPFHYPIRLKWNQNHWLAQTRFPALFVRLVHWIFRVLLASISMCRAWYRKKFWTKPMTLHNPFGRSNHPIHTIHRKTLFLRLA